MHYSRLVRKRWHLQQGRILGGGKWSRKWTQRLCPTSNPLLVKTDPDVYFFSSQRTEKEAAEYPARVWEKATLRLIESPVGTLNNFNVLEAEHALIFWQDYNHASIPLGSDSELSEVKASQLSFHLLDRLEEEIVAEITAALTHSDQLRDEFANRSLDARRKRPDLVDRLREELEKKKFSTSSDGENKSSAIQDVLSYKTISLTVNRWRLLLKDHAWNPPEVGSGQCHNLPEPLSPESVLEKVESYAFFSQNFLPDVALYNMILSGVGSFHAGRASTKVHSFLNHMTNKGVLPDAITYASAIAALALDNDPVEASNHAVAMLETLKQNVGHPSMEAYGSVLGALGRSVRVRGQSDKAATARQAEALLEEMQGYGIAPNALIKSTVMFAWAQSYAPEAGDRAQALLDRMLQDYSVINKNLAQDEKAIYKPNQYSFSNVMTAHAKKGNVEQVEKLLQQMQNLYEQSNGDPDFFPNVFCFNALIDAWYHFPSGSKTNAQHAESVLQRMVDYSHQTGRGDCLPNLFSFNLVLRVHSQEQNPKHYEEAARRSLGILEHMRRLGLTPDTIACNTVLESFSKCHHNPQWAKKAEWIVQEEMPQPDVTSYRNLIRALAGNAEKAERALRDMCNSSSRGVQPDASCFNVVIAAWSRSGSLQAGPRAEALLRMMKLDQNIEPDATTYNGTMSCWTSMANRQPEAAGRAWSILRYMKQQANVKPTLKTYTTCIWALAFAREPQKAEELFLELEEAERENPQMKPGRIVYCALLSAWARVGHASKAQAIFNTMVARSNDDPSLRPNTEIYSTLLNAWAMARDVERAVAVLQEMCDDYAQGKNPLAIPNERCFTSVIDALSRSKHPDAAPQAEACLQKMQEMADCGLAAVRPNVHTFQKIITAWANSDVEVAAQEAERNLQRLKDLYDKEGDVRCRPNVIAYTNTLRAWSRSSRLRYPHDDGRVAVERSEDILAEMLSSSIPGVQPNHVTFGTVLQTIADSRLPDKMERAQRIGRAMQEIGLELDRFSSDQLMRIRRSTMSNPQGSGNH